MRTPGRLRERNRFWTPVLGGLGAVVLAALVGAAGLLASTRALFPGAPFSQAEVAYNPYNLVRLHVLAASDRPEDQALKLAARDAVIDFLAPRWGQVRDTAGALAVLEANRAELGRLLAELVAAGGKDYGVTVEVGYFPFPQRTYGHLTLPAGTYPALRVILGQGGGANWWCVLFPPLCFLETRPGAFPLPDDPVALAAALDREQAEAGRPLTGPEVRFFILDWLRSRGVDPARWVQRWRAALID